MLSGSFIRAKTLGQAEASFRRFQEIGMGNLVCLNVSHLGYEGGMAMIEKLVEAGVYFILNGNIAGFGEGRIRKVQELAGDYFVGSAVVTELSSLSYWDRDYFKVLDRQIDWKAALDTKLFGADDLPEARGRFLDVCEEVLREKVGVFIGDTPDLVFDAGLYQRNLLDCGAAFPCLEMVCGNPELMFAGARGAARSKDISTWMSYIPECYLGNQNDVLRQKRFFLAYMTSYIVGAGMILRESGTFLDRGRVYEKAEKASMYAGYDDYDTYENADYRTFRDVSAAFWRFAQADDRPDGGPETPLGIVKGELDGYVGMWDRRVWGQHHSAEWEYCDIEREWDFFWQLYRRREWSDYYHYGTQDDSGNPPCGQVDVVPGEASLEAWQRYSCLLFLGWNTMTPELYGKILEFVSGGGRVIMSLSHCRSNIRRGEAMELFAGGDLSELFGVKVKGPSARHVQGVRFVEELSWCSGLPVWQTYDPDVYSCDPVCIDGPIQLAEFGRIDATVVACASEGLGPTRDYPIVVEKRIGRGSAVLISAWSTPGQMPMRSMMHTLIQTVSAGQEPGVRFCGSDRFRYAVYGQGKHRKVYVLNTDYDIAQQCKLTVEGKSTELLVGPCTLQALTLDDKGLGQGCCLSFSDIVGS